MRDTRDSLQRFQQWPAATFDARRRDSIARLAALKDSCKGERCFIIGNGPSLKQTDLSRLKNEKTIGMNRFYLMFPELGFKTSYFVSINDLVVEQCAADLANAGYSHFYFLARPAMGAAARRPVLPVYDLYRSRSSRKTSADGYGKGQRLRMFPCRLPTSLVSNRWS